MSTLATTKRFDKPQTTTNPSPDNENEDGTSTTTTQEEQDLWKAAGKAADLVNCYADIPPPLDVEYEHENDDDIKNKNNPWRQPHLIFEELLQQNQVLQDAWKAWLQTQQQQDENVGHDTNHHPSFMECLTDILGDDLEQIRQAAAVALEEGEGDDPASSSAAVEILVECLQTTATQLFTKQEQDEIRNHHLTQNDDIDNHASAIMHMDEDDSSSSPSNRVTTAHERYQRNNRI